MAQWVSAVAAQGLHSQKQHNGKRSNSHKSSSKYHMHAIAVCVHTMRRHQYTLIKIKSKRAGSKEEKKGGKRKERKTTGALVAVIGVLVGS